jgi:hypothetical protein
VAHADVALRTVDEEREGAGAELRLDPLYRERGKVAGDEEIVAGPRTVGWQAWLINTPRVRPSSDATLVIPTSSSTGRWSGVRRFRPIPDTRPEPTPTRGDAVLPGAGSRVLDRGRQPVHALVSVSPD